MSDPKKPNRGPQSAEEKRQQAATSRETNRPADSTPVVAGQFVNLPAMFGRYQVERLLGRGAMGAVYLATDTQLDRRVALKIPKVAASGSKRLLQRLETEAKAAAKLDHPSLCKVFDAGAVGEQCFIAMQYIEGETLKSQLEAQSKSVAESVSLMIQLAEGLSEAHALGIIHRDLKPENIMINRKGTPVIMDFGLAKFSTINSNAVATQAGTILGSPAYMSPEQASGHTKEINQRSDIYALGTILFELLTGQLPFTGSTMQVLGQKSILEPPAVRTIQPDLPPQLAATCDKMLAKDPLDRYQDLAEVIADLQRIDFNRSPQASVIRNPRPVRLPNEMSENTPELADLRITPIDERQRSKPAPRNSRVASLPWLQQMGGWWSRQTPVMKWTALGSAGALLIACSVLLFVVTRHGTVQIEIDDPRLSVRFDADTITVENDGKRFSVSPTAKHTLQVLQDGVTIESATKELTIRRGETRLIAIKLVGNDVLVDGQRISNTAGAVTAVAKAPGNEGPDLKQETVPTIEKNGTVPLNPTPEAVTEEQLRQRIETAWPGLGNRLSKDGAGNYTLHLRGCEQVTDLTPLKGMPLTTLNITYNGKLSDLTPLQGMKLKSLWIGRCGQIRDLRPLQGMELDFLDLAQCNGLDLSQLKGMKIKALSLWNRATNQTRFLPDIQVQELILSYSHIDLAPLKGMPITSLVIDHCGGFTDLSALKDLPLTTLNFIGCDQIADVTPLKNMPLKEIDCDFKPARDAQILRAIKTLEKINGKPADQFWREFDAQLAIEASTKNTSPLSATPGLAPAKRIPIPANAVSFGNKKYVLIKDQLKWHDARNKCQELGGRLAEVRSAAENDFLKNLAVAGEMENIWLGGTDEAGEGRWLWSDGSELKGKFNNWSSIGGQPNNGGGRGEHYIVMYISRLAGQWCDQPAAPIEKVTGYICEWDIAPAAEETNGGSKTGAVKKGTKAGQNRSNTTRTTGKAFFNGKTLTGWKGIPALWAVKDGEILGSTLPGGIKFNTCLCSERQYGDFELTCKIQLNGPAGANSGIQIRSEVIDSSRFVVQGPQCDIGPGYWGSLYNEGFGAMLRVADKSTVDNALKTDGYNELFIRCVGKNVLIKLNGVETVNQDFPELPPKGIIGWQLHGGAGFMLRVKDIVFQDLSAAK